MAVYQSTFIRHNTVLHIGETQCFVIPYKSTFIDLNEVLHDTLKEVLCNI